MSSSFSKFCFKSNRRWSTIFGMKKENSEMQKIIGPQVKNQT